MPLRRLRRQPKRSPEQRWLGILPSMSMPLASLRSRRNEYAATVPLGMAPSDAHGA